MPRGLIIALFLALTWLVGCTGGDLPSAPDPGEQKTSPSASATVKATLRPTASPTFSWD